MKLKTKIIAGTAALAFFAFAAGSLQAQQQVTNLLTITATLQAQGGTNNNGTITTVAAPVKSSFNTKQILALLARDEFAAGRYGFTNFPVGAKLVVIASDTTDYCQVVDKHNGFLVDVSNVLTFQNSPFGDLHSGKTANSTGWGAPTVTKLQMPTIGYDDSAISGGVGFRCTLVGLMKRTVTYTIHNRSSLIVNTSAKLTGGIGTGTNQGTPFLITGSMNAAGKRTFD
jgi:hypothetical protein